MADDELLGPPVASYTREEAIDDGHFLSVPPSVAAGAGIAMPVVITAGAEKRFVDGGGKGRLQEVLSTVARSVGRAPAGEHCAPVPVPEVHLPSGQPPTVQGRLWAYVGPGDRGEQAMMLMLGNEI